MRPTAAYVDLDKLVHNYNAIKRHVGDKTRIMAMVKADAYGHGLLPVSKTLEQAGADYLGVAMIEEGVRLRRANVKLPILCVGASFKSSLEEGIKEDIILTLYETGQLCDMQEAAERVGKKARVHIKLETGMNRLGAHTDGELLQLARELKKYDMVQAEGVFTHFAASDSAFLLLIHTVPAANTPPCKSCPQKGYPRFIIARKRKSRNRQEPDHKYIQPGPGKDAGQDTQGSQTAHLIIQHGTDLFSRHSDRFHASHEPDVIYYRNIKNIIDQYVAIHNKQYKKRCCPPESWFG